MYLLNEFGLFGDKKKNNLLPKLGSKLGGIGYGAKRQLQGAKEGFKTGLDLGKKEFKRSGNSKIKNPVKVAAVNGTKIGAKLGKAVGTVEGKVKGYKKGKELQNKLPKFSYKIIDEFSKKKQSTSKALAGGAVVGAGGSGTLLGGKYLIDTKKRLHEAKKYTKVGYDFIERGRKGMRENHPDRVARTFDNKQLQETYENVKKKQFQEANKLKSLGESAVEEFEPLSKKKYTQVIKEDAINTGKRIKSKVGKGVNLLKANKGKAALGLGALALGTAGAVVANKLRKSRADKGKLRGKYSK